MSGRVDTAQVFEPTKARQRAVAAELLPEHIVSRPKRGFTPPVRKWAKAIWQVNEVVLTGDATIAYGNVNADAVAQVLARPIARFGRVDQMALRLMTLELWVRSLL